MTCKHEAVAFTSTLKQLSPGQFFGDFLLRCEQCGLDLTPHDPIVLGKKVLVAFSDSSDLDINALLRGALTTLKAGLAPTTRAVCPTCNHGISCFPGHYVCMCRSCGQVLDFNHGDIRRVDQSELESFTDEQRAKIASAQLMMDTVKKASRSTSEPGSDAGTA